MAQPTSSPLLTPALICPALPCPAPLIHFSAAADVPDAPELLHVLYERITATTRACREAGLVGAAGVDLDAVFGLALHE